MKTYVPDYYPKFHCIAGRCRHSCCIGWEIDIDEDTYDLYQSIGGGFGKRLKNNIEDGDVPHFRLCADERCPFLNSDGLCDIILTLGEGALCQICDDHPRYRNFYSSRTEMGLGLCCEAAAKLILTQPGHSKLILLDEDEEDEMPLCEEEITFLEKREALFHILWNDGFSAEESMNRILDAVGIKLPEKSHEEWIEYFSSLECLDESRNHLLRTASERALPHEFQIPALKLLEYFLYRHLAGSLEDDRFAVRAAFAVLSTGMICRMWAGILAEKGILTAEDMADCARIYSSEYEYSDENTQALLDLIETESERRILWKNESLTDGNIS